jgi:lipid II:glycine glycyltransferase (peptidoglycan interpeptide bridge formation enzyme)
MILNPISITDPDAWNGTLAQMPTAHVLQTWQWGEFKAATTGWMPHRIAYTHQGAVVAMAQILIRRAGPFQIGYAPRGPALDYTNPPLRAAVLDHLKQYAHEHGLIFLKIDPDVVMGLGVPGEFGAFDDPTGLQIAAEWGAAGLRFSNDQIQFRNSMVIDLRPPEEAILAAMKQKTRYNVRLSERRGVTARPGTVADMELLYRLYTETALRDGFVVRPFEYYRLAWQSFMQARLAQPIIAEYKGRPIAHVIIFGFGKRAWYFYGASSDEERQHMPTYLLQWEAMRWAKSQGMLAYDMWGAPDNFYDEGDPLAGVFRFKEGFGGLVSRRIGAWDYVANPLLYTAYTQIMPAVLNVMRSLGQRRMRQASP